jgi:hypothetical protein
MLGQEVLGRQDEFPLLRRCQGQAAAFIPTASPAGFHLHKGEGYGPFPLGNQVNFSPAATPAVLSEGPSLLAEPMGDELFSYFSNVWHEGITQVC